jgi:hypothetical protein
MDFKIEDYVFYEPEEVDFGSLESKDLEALFLESCSSHPPMAIACLGEILRRSRRDPKEGIRCAPMVEEAMVSRKMDERVFAFALYALYGMDRQRGQRTIASVSDTCNSKALNDASESLAPDIQLYRGEPGFDAAVSSVAARLKRDSQNGRELTYAELNLLRTAGYPVVPEADVDPATDADRGRFKAYCTQGTIPPCISVERLSNQEDVIRAETCVQDDKTLVVRYEVLEIGMKESFARKLIFDTILTQLLADAYRGKVTHVMYHNSTTNQSVTRPYGAPD